MASLRAFPLLALASLASCNAKLEPNDPPPPAASGIPVGAQGAVGVHFPTSAGRAAAPLEIDDDEAPPPTPLPLPLPQEEPPEPPGHTGPASPPPPPKKGMPL